MKRRWDEIKADEKKDKPRQGLLEPVPRNMPALVEAQQISSKAAGVGIRLGNPRTGARKARRRTGRAGDARARAHRTAEIEGEVGDLLFVLVNLARFLKVDPEQALRKTNAKFRKRFGYVESKAKLPGAGIQEMEALWQESKTFR